jgi:precorrin-6B methylase 2
MIEYIGDLSAADARVLAREGARTSSLLEFGVGGSTHIFAQTLAPDARFVSVDTDAGWIEKTKSNLRRLQIGRSVRFLSYAGLSALDGPWETIFVDGLTRLRLDFARRHWGRLLPGGRMLFHDTRRPGDASNVATLLKENFLSVGSIGVNIDESNISVMVKREPVKYVDWNVVEGGSSLHTVRRVNGD